MIIGVNEGEHVTSLALRNIKLGSIMSQITAAGADSHPAVRAIYEQVVEPSSQKTDVEPRHRPGRKGHTEEFIRSVADRYRRALVEHPTRPTKAVSEQINYSLAQTRRLVAKARALGFVDDQEDDE